MKRLDVWLLQPAPAERLGALRILIGGFVWVYLLANIGEFARVAAQPSSPFEPVGIVRLWGTPLSPTMVWSLFIALLVAGAGFIAGLWFRFNGLVFAVLVLVWASYHSSWGQMLHFEHLFTLHIMVLAFSPAAAAWSLDSQRLSTPPKPASTIYGWPIRLMALITAVTYVIAAIAKVRRSGVAWVDGSSLGNHIGYSATRIELLGGFEPPLASLVVGRPWLLVPMAIGALVVEFLAPAAFVNDRMRNTWVGAALLFHLGTAATMLVWFPYQGLAFAFLPLFAVERLARFRRYAVANDGTASQVA